jgi:hypothetical protein
VLFHFQAGEAAGTISQRPAKIFLRDILRAWHLNLKNADQPRICRDGARARRVNMDGHGFQALAENQRLNLEGG